MYSFLFNIHRAAVKVKKRDPRGLIDSLGENAYHEVIIAISVDHGTPEAVCRNL